jgi:hypothetical protein
MAYNVSVLKDANGNIVNGARVLTVTAQGATCVEFVAQDKDRDGILVMNRSLSADLGITMIGNPEGQPNTATLTTAQAWAARIAKIAPNTTEEIPVKAGTRVLFSAESTTPDVAIGEVNA